MHLSSSAAILVVINSQVIYLVHHAPPLFLSCYKLSTHKINVPKYLNQTVHIYCSAFLGAEVHGYYASFGLFL